MREVFQAMLADAVGSTCSMAMRRFIGVMHIQYHTCARWSVHVHVQDTCLIDMNIRYSSIDLRVRHVSNRRDRGPLVHAKAPGLWSAGVYAWPEFMDKRGS